MRNRQCGLVLEESNKDPSGLVGMASSFHHLVVTMFLDCERRTFPERLGSLWARMNFHYPQLGQGYNAGSKPVLGLR